MRRSTSIVFFLVSLAFLFIVSRNPKDSKGLPTDISSNPKENIAPEMPISTDKVDKEPMHGDLPESNTSPEVLAMPVLGDSCKYMEKYSNATIQRSDIMFSNFEGTVQVHFPFGHGCDGGVWVQELPTGFKTCTNAFHH